MGFKDLFVERKDEELNLDPSSLPDYSDIAGPDVETVKAPEEVADFIQEAYKVNDLSPRDKSIYKVDELIKTLPKEMPEKTKYDTINGILSSFNLAPTDLHQDGLDRIQIIKSTYAEAEKEINGENKAAEENIEHLKLEIEKLQKEIDTREHKLEQINISCNKEIELLSDLCNFLFPQNEEG